MAKLRGAAEVFSGAAKAAPDPVPARAVQAALPLVDASVLSIEMARNPLRANAVAAARGRGRPKGSRNRRSEELVRYVLAKHSHPMIVLAQVYSRPVEMLAAEVGCTTSEALAMQVRAASEALPYFESKKPVAVQLDGRVIQLIMHAGTAAANEDLPPWEAAARALGTIGGTVQGGGDE